MLNNAIFPPLLTSPGVNEPYVYGLRACREAPGCLLQ